MIAKTAKKSMARPTRARVIAVFTALALGQPHMVFAYSSLPPGASITLDNVVPLTGRTSLGIGMVSGNDKTYAGGMKTSNADNSAAFNAAYTAACALNQSLWISPGTYSFTAAPAPLTCGIRIVTAGSEVTIFNAARLNGCFITRQVNGANVEGEEFKGLTLQASFNGGDNYSASAGFCLTGDSSFYGYAKFHDLRILGFHDGFYTSKTSPIVWSTFDDIMIENFSKGTINAFHSITGSGTGDVYTNIKAKVGDSNTSVAGSVFTFDTGGNVGDLLITASHLGGFPGSVGMTIGAGATYLSRISWGTTQFDAGIVYPFKLDPSGTYTDLHLGDSNNIGGGTDLYTNIPPLRNSITVDQEVGRWESGYLCPTGLPSGANTVELFKVDTNTGSYTGTVIDLTVSGLVSAAFADVVSAKYQISVSGGTPTIIPLEMTQSTVASGAFSLSASVVGGVSVFSLTFNAPGTGSTCDAQIVARGGPVRIKRG